jgi:hypothetical protein
MEGMRVLRTAVFACLVLVALPATAFAQAVEGYEDEGEGVQEQLGAEAEVAAGGALPFTGVDLLVLTLAAVLLMAVGFTIRRVSRARG